MQATEIIARKRDGRSLTRDQIRWFVSGFAEQRIPDYQMAALAMAICIRGMDADETFALTESMLESGERLERLPDGPPRVDKHSTGGLGDKVSLILAPWLAACGLHVPMISGRGLGFSGGTLDKLESIPGFRVNWEADDSTRILRQVGCFIIAANSKLVPADKRLYALRDVTGTVESVPLITASILSKKLAEQLDALIMDVKVGTAAFMKTIEQARELSHSIARVSSAFGTPCDTVISDMHQPLGRAVGNSVEVNEALDVLRGEGPPDVIELTRLFATRALLQTGVVRSSTEAEQLLDEKRLSGAAFEQWMRMVRAQGANWDGRPLPVAPATEVLATTSGFIHGCDGAALGNAVIQLGGGRRVLTDPLDHSVGLMVYKKIGESVEKGEPLCAILGKPAEAMNLERIVRDAFVIRVDKCRPMPLVHDLIES